MIDRSKFWPTSVLQAYKEIAIGEIAMIEQYLTELSEQFESRRIDSGRYFSSHTDEPGSALIEEEYFRNAVHFPQILKSSILVALYSELEITLKTLVDRCIGIPKFHGSAQKRNEKKDEKPYEAIRILKKLFHVRVDENLWAKMEQYRIVRNLFVHHGGNFQHLSDEKKSEVFEIIRNSGEQLIYHEQTMDLAIYSKQYLIRYTQLLTQLLGSIFDQLIARHNPIIQQEKEKKYKC